MIKRHALDEGLLGNATLHNFKLPEARKLLAEWNNTFGYDNAVALVDDWARQSFAKSFTSLTEDAFAHRALLRLFIDEIEPFDCFQIAGWKPSENQTERCRGGVVRPKLGASICPENS